MNQDSAPAPGEPSFDHLGFTTFVKLVKAHNRLHDVMREVMMSAGVDLTSDDDDYAAHAGVTMMSARSWTKDEVVAMHQARQLIAQATTKLGNNSGTQG